MRPWRGCRQQAGCQLTLPDAVAPLDASVAGLPASGGLFVVMPLQAAVTMPPLGGSVQLSCFANGPVTAVSIKLGAIKVGTLTVGP